MTETDADTILERAGFDPDESILTRRQAEVLALRERGLTQSAIAERFGTSRANVASIESSARENVRKARDTVAVAEALRSPVRVQVVSGTDLYDVPSDVFDACDEADVKVPHTAPELLGEIADGAGDAVVGREVRTDLLVSVSADGEIRVRRQTSGD
ncbi:Tfx family DNA-binding protein [Halapricum desulfuricans]|uniref:Transcriptional regulator n=1 Tax=Halapricum desulfuricans TaxID=2841257 RepID=A0A897NWU5_9EURY|nr:Tfx family DNA-binding protein [Halapricum desulfuricans]QSG15099.1 Transcriptional regulator [Halapricum desulfuricans]